MQFPTFAPDAVLRLNASRARGRCPHCENASSFVFRGSQRFADRTDDTSVTVTRQMQVQCDFCTKLTVTIREEVYARTPDGAQGALEGANERLMWPEPSPRPLSKHAPADVQSFFREAAKAESVGAMRLAGVGYRAVVELIAKERGATGNNLKAKIISLASKGVPQDLVDNFHEARLVGNDSIHDGLEYSAEEIADIADLITEAVLVLYEQPAQRAAMAAARQAKRSGQPTAAVPAPSTPTP